MVVHSPLMTDVIRNFRIILKLPPLKFAQICSIPNLPGALPPPPLIAAPRQPSVLQADSLAADPVWSTRRPAAPSPSFSSAPAAPLSYSGAEAEAPGEDQPTIH
ncbi:hypothetical protein ACQJBY_015175 [Aegilops geniculata]